MIINGVDYQVIEEVEIKELGQHVPVLDVPVMTDEQWNRLVKKQKAGEFHG
jgi:hypothetical protein